MAPAVPQEGFPPQAFSSVGGWRHELFVNLSHVAPGIQVVCASDTFVLQQGVWLLRGPVFGRRAHDDGMPPHDGSSPGGEAGAHDGAVDEEEGGLGVEKAWKQAFRGVSSRFRLLLAHVGARSHVVSQAAMQRVIRKAYNGKSWKNVVPRLDIYHNNLVDFDRFR